jgi:hypothetical protein
MVKTTLNCHGKRSKPVKLGELDETSLDARIVRHPFKLRAAGQCILPRAITLSHDGRETMKYMLLIYTDENSWTDNEREHCYLESTELTQQLHANGKYLSASPLHPVATATSVRVRDGKRLVTDGPFAETREQLGGYFLIEAKDLDEALDVAGRIPGARKGTVEVRPVIELAGLPDQK